MPELELVLRSMRDEEGSAKEEEIKRRRVWRARILD